MAGDNGLLSREQILGIHDLKRQEVDVSEWWGEGAKVLVRELNAHERIEFGLLFGDSITADGLAKVVAATVINGDGAQVFTEEDVEQLGRKNGRALRAIFDAVCEISGLTEDEEGKDGRDSEETQGSVSPTD